MRRFLCLLLGVLFLTVFAVGAMAEVLDEPEAPPTEVTEENPEDGVEPVEEPADPGMTQEDVDTYVGELRQSVQSQLAVADMALSMARTPATEEPVAGEPPVPEEPVEGEVTEVTEEEEVMDPEKALALAERHAFIAYAHLTGIPASRKLQENLTEFQDLWQGVVDGELTVSQAFAAATEAGTLEAATGKGKRTGGVNPGHINKPGKVQPEPEVQATGASSTGKGKATAKEDKGNNGQGNNGNHGGGNGGGGNGNGGGNGGGNNGGGNGNSKK